MSMRSKCNVLAAMLVWAAIALCGTSVQAQYTVDSTQVGGWDGYIFVYESPFDPLDQLTNFLAGNDDGPGGIGTSQIADVALSAGVEYVLVTTGFLAGDEGAYDSVISGPLGPVMISGDTTGGPTWERPIAGGTCCSSLGPVTYEAVPFRLVPEPSSLALIATGLLFFFHRR